ncbi:tRNA (adenosine(37)-N6)-dimethylallyltransferase MiaA [Patescibacteria group bacterium]|nr:tRNA (adenosine(37)-N6)-dimethylallyltransferase MiaA [Patescibacteria group bacterium]MBU1499922.1 tRNA (adenosine(37)-N6)-dimethylallyltransferase MiaA [Patescibacteria group bacterium]
MKKILIICGPTATGKTKLAASLAKKFSGEIISADSRQVYQGMDIVTGKDRPKGVKIHGLDLVKPDEEFSVAHFVKYAHSLINQIRFPIIVGGTGLYLNALVNPPQTLTIPPDWQLRKKLEKKSIEQLQQQLKKINPLKFAQMNHSDQQNPRRLIRAIEVVKFPQGPAFPSKRTDLNQYDTFWLGLTADNTTLAERIEARVKQRVKAGAVKEWQGLKTKYRPNLPSMSAIGYRQLPDVTKWIQAEQQYARRQLTWFKKNSNIHWFDTTKAFQSPVVNLVKAWYTKK